MSTTPTTPQPAPDAVDDLVVVIAHLAGEYLHGIALLDSTPGDDAHQRHLNTHDALRHACRAFVNA